MPLEYDVVILGSGPAGEKAAFQAAKLRKRVALVDRGTQLGGNCLHTGTIPSKTLRETVLHIAAARTRNVSGLTTRLSKDVTLHAMMESQAVLAFGGPVDYFVETVFNYPTLSEAYKVAALNGLNRL
jgi:pyruvate/2-oxoglutarate dehydrogenase complex dihydrolipoamide dehydrogenase (E3) component